MHAATRARQFADPPRDVIMEELYVRKKLGPFCCECFFLMNNLRGRSDSTFSSHRKNTRCWKFPGNSDDRDVMLY